MRIVLWIVFLTFVAGANFAWGGQFEEIPVRISGYRLRDVGFADINGDGYLDTFTTNDSGLQSIKYGAGHGYFKSNTIAALGLDQDSNFSGFANTNRKPAFTTPGLYIYYFEKNLYLTAYNIAPSTRISGKITRVGSFPVVKLKNFTVDISEVKLTSAWKESTADFKADGNGVAVLSAQSMITPLTFELDPGVVLENVYVGLYKTNPRSSTFTTTTFDRHGFAWADYNGDGLLDAFIVGGGMSGVESFKTIPITINDELFQNNGTRYEDVTAASGIVKAAGRGRKAAWVDFDGDGRLDLFIGNEATPNHLWKKTADATFVDVAPELGLDLANTGSFVWVDADNDGDMDLVISADPDFLMFINEGGTFRKKVIGANPTGTAGLAYGTMSVADYDGNGYLDIFVASSKGNMILRNLNGRFTLVNPETVGLPAVSNAATFVDYDNDGTQEVFCVPGGIYRQQSDHTFTGTGILPFKVGDRQVRISWGDVNNDGTRDLLISSQAFNEHEWRTRLFLNHDDAANHWLELNLMGPAGNHQAIGAQVRVTTGARTQLLQVGHAEGSRHSQGHYRLYFGLGAFASADSIQISWPDGTTQLMNNVPADQVLTVTYNVSSSAP